MELVTYINCLLVEKNARPAFLPNSNNEINTILNNFPTLQVVILNNGWGLIVKNIRRKSYYKKDIGILLGYPCNGETGHIFKHRYSFEFFIKMKNGDKVQFLASMCDTLNKLNKFQKMIEKFKNIILNDSLLNKKVDDVILKITELFPVKYFIEKLSNNELLDENEMDQIYNILWNEHTDFINKSIEFKNSDHINLILQILDYLNQHKFNINENEKNKIFKNYLKKFKFTKKKSWFNFW